LERENDDRERQERLEAPVKEAIEKLTREASQTAGKIAAVEMQTEWQRVRRELTSAPSPEWVATVQDYDGRFKTADEVTNAIDAAFKSFSAKTADDDVKLTYEFLSHNWQHADTSRESIWESAYQYAIGKLDAVKAKYAPEPVAPAAPKVELTPTERRRKELTEKRDSAKPGSDAYLKADHALMVFDGKSETLGEENYTNALQRICTESGLKISESVNQGFHTWLYGPLGRPFQADLSRPETYEFAVRRAFATYTGVFTGPGAFLTEDELTEIARLRGNDQASSADVLRTVGRSRSYGSGNQPGIR
jgi:uncharacterized protein YqeY